MTKRSHEQAPALGGPLSIIFDQRSTQRTLCNELECIADQLGGPVDSNLCESVLRRLENDLPLYHLDEELLFSVLCSQDEGDLVLAQCAALATAEHRANETYVFELSEPLRDIGSGGALHSINTVGYMLRGCFDGLRRHLEWEDVVLLNGREQTLTGSSMKALEAGLARNRRTRSRHVSLFE